MPASTNLKISLYDLSAFGLPFAFWEGDFPQNEGQGNSRFYNLNTQLMKMWD
jgi:hypothetical protein